MVTEGRLFMPAAAYLGDEIEGTQPPGNVHWWQTLADKASSLEQRGIIEHNRELISRFAAAFRTRYYMSCWHVNEKVNPEMWKLYANTAESVAICAKFGKLRAALPTYVDVVEGLDQKHFQAHHFEDENNPNFRVYAPRIKSADLISGVFIHPAAPSDFAKAAEELCEKNGIPKPQRADW